MTKRFLFRFALLMVLSSASVLAFCCRRRCARSTATRAIAATAGQGHDEPRGDNGNHNGWFREAARLPTGHYITPTAIDDAVQTTLNPGLPAYPDFVAGMAVRSRSARTARRWRSSPPARTRSTGRTGPSTSPTRRSTSFSTTSRAPNRTRPALMQVLKQTNAHVGLVFSPDGRHALRHGRQ